MYLNFIKAINSLTKTLRLRTRKNTSNSKFSNSTSSHLQVVILGSSTFVPFMQLSAPHRREVIEDLLDINIFSNMNQLLKDRVRTTLAQSKDCEHLVSVAEERVTSQRKLISSLKDVNDTRQKEKQKRITDNEKRIKEEKKNKVKFDKELTAVESSLKGVDDQKNLLNELRQSQSGINSELKSAAKELKFSRHMMSVLLVLKKIEKAFKNAVIGGLREG